MLRQLWVLLPRSSGARAILLGSLLVLLMCYCVVCAIVSAGRPPPVPPTLPPSVFTLTSTPSASPGPSETPAPSATATPTRRPPTATFTQAATRTPLPTGTPTPTATATRSPTPPPQILIDFVKTASEANWRDGTGPLAFGDLAPSRGSARWTENAQMEDGRRYALILETRPDAAPNASVRGTYPQAVALQSGDRLRLSVGFLRGASSGNVTYRVTYYPPCPTEGGCGVQIARFASTYNGALVSRVEDLTAQAGTSGTFELLVEGGPSATGDSAAWITAQIERSAP